MNGEILSIETTQKIARLEKENSEYEKIICNFDKEINRQFNIIKDATAFVNNHKRKDEFLKLNEWDTRELLSILNRVNEVQNV